MKKLMFLILVTSFGLTSFASKEDYEVGALYQCRPDDSNEPIEVSVHRRIHGIGPQKYVGVVNRTNVVRLNLTQIYGGRIVSFTSADLRIRFDRIKVVEEKMQAFIQIPKLKVYSDHWTCKGPSYKDLPELD